MSGTPDPDALRALATRVDTQAAHLAGLDGGLTPGTAVAWRGRAADRFEFELGVLRRGLGDTCDQLRAAAAALRSHADTVERELTLIRAAAQATADAVIGPVGTVSMDSDALRAFARWAR